MKITVAPSNRGIAIGILIAVLLFLLALFLIIYLLITLLKCPPRQLPMEPNSEYAQYLFEPNPSPAKFLEPDGAPEGMRYVSATLLASTNCHNWGYVSCRVDADGRIHAPDGSILELHGTWDEGLQEWTALFPVVVRGGTNEAMFFRVP